MLGNGRTSRFTQVQAEEFLADGWKVVEHKSNTETGFSGTLFKNSNTGELVISFRSTEFADDAARDNQATNTLEIKEKGWAFGQIDDMEKWYAHLKTAYAQDFAAANNQFTVTGYSLGGHLATAFNLLRQQDGTSGQIAGTYTFNGAGVGQTLDGVSLTQTMQTFRAIREQGAASYFTQGSTQVLYLQPLDGNSFHYQNNSCLRLTHKRHRPFLYPEFLKQEPTHA